MEDQPAKYRGLIKLIFFILILAAGIWAGQHYQVDIESYQETFRAYPLAISGPLFVLVYVVTTTVFLLGPHDILRITSAVLFGAKISTVLITIGDLGNAVIMFYISRVLGREFVEQRFNFKKKKSLYDIEREPSFWTILAFRANPLISYRMTDIGFGLSNVSFFKYMEIGRAHV